MMLRPPMPQYSELISLLTSFETWILNQNVPKLRQNLLSISQLTQENNYDITFNNDGFYITNRSDGRVIARGNRAGSPYQLAPTYHMAFFSTRQQRVSPSTWHSILGHCNMNTIDTLVKQGLL